MEKGGRILSRVLTSMHYLVLTKTIFNLYEALSMKNITAITCALALGLFSLASTGQDMGKLVEAVDQEKAADSVDTEKLTDAVSDGEVDYKKAYDAVDKEKAADSVDMDKVKEAMTSPSSE